MSFEELKNVIDCLIDDETTARVLEALDYVLLERDEAAMLAADLAERE